MLQKPTSPLSRLNRSTKARALLFILSFALIGTALLFATRAATPFASLEPEQGTKTPEVTTISDAGASGGQYVRFGGGATQPGGTYPARGSVGYLGDPNALTVINGSSSVPAGTIWTSGGEYLRVNGNNLTLDGVYVKGGIDFYGCGTLTIRNSIVEAGYGNYFGLIAGRCAGSVIDVQDSTLKRVVPPPQGSGNGAIQPLGASFKVIAIRNDISGTADGIQVGGDDWVITDNWIHDLAMVGTYPDNTHNDGIQVFGGATNLTFARNRMETGAVAPYSNSPLFAQGAGSSGTIENNFLDGGGYSLYLQDGSWTVRDNVFGPSHLYAERRIESGATILQWLDNCKGELGGIKFEPCQAVAR